MKRTLTVTGIITATALLITSVMGGVALAHPAPYDHYHPAPAKRRVVKKRVVYRTTPAPPTVVVVEPAPAPERVMVRPAPAPAPTYVEVNPTPAPVVVHTQRPQAKPRRSWSSPMSVGVRLSGAAGDTSASGETPVMGGAGLQFRTRFTEEWGLEASADVMGAGTRDFDQLTVPVQVSAMYHLFPESQFQLYGLAGLGVEFSRLSYLGGQYAIDMVDVGGQLGIGAEFFVTRDISLTADVRGKFMFATVDSQAKIRTDCLHQSGDQTGFCDGISGASDDDKLNMGIQFHAGANIYF